MGYLQYDGVDFEFEDRLLAHLQIVISTKLRRNEDFFLSWRPSPATGEGRHAIWIDNGIPLHFLYSGSKHPIINREWVEALILSAASATGLHVTDEPVPGSGDRPA